LCTGLYGLKTINIALPRIGVAQIYSDDKNLFLDTNPMAVPLIIDIIVLVILLISTIVAVLRGFLREMMTIVGVLGGLLAAYWAGPSVSDIIADWLGVNPDSPPKRLFGMIGYDMVAIIAGYGGVFLVVLLLISLFSYLLTKSVHIAGLGPIDRTLGVFFGLARGVLIVAILYLPFHLVDNKSIERDWFAPAQSHAYMQAVAEWMVNLVPANRDSGGMSGTPGKAAGEAIDATREKLEKLEVLKGADKPAPAKEKGQKGEQTGYDAETREQMNELIEKESGDDESGQGQPK
jgi:membrane protein required for colicin V production